MKAARGPRKVIQEARGTGLARIYQSAGDLIVYGGGEPYRWASWPAPAVGPQAAQARAQPSELLRAANALIDFTGRRAVLTELNGWREGGGRQGVAVQLIHGPGGQGKTRLAGQVAHRWQRAGWVVLAAHHKRDRSTPEHFEVPAFDRAAGVLVVVDYAERWDTADLLALLRDTHLPGRLPVRVLLLARPAGTWWHSLKGRIQRDLHLVPDRRQLEPLEQEEGITRGDLFAAARDRFGELLGVRGVDAAAPPALERHEAYQLVLTVHVAALAAVLAHDRGQTPPTDPVQVSQFLLARERDHWEAMCARGRDNPLATSPDAMAQIVYTATVTGRLDHTAATAAIARAAIESREHPGQLLKEHALCYPPAVPAGPAPGHHTLSSVARDTPTVLEPLYPDRLGEDFIALSTPGHRYEFPADPWAGAAPARLLTPGLTNAQPNEPDDVPVWVGHGLITLIEAARRWPHLAQHQLYPLLAAQPHLALHAGGAALATLAGLDDIEPMLLAAIESVLPTHRHIDLDIGIAAVTARLAEHRLAAATDPAERARVQDILAVRLSYAGLHTRALDESSHTLQIRRRLTEADRDAHLPDLAASLSNHAALLAKVGRRDAAVPVSEEAVGLHRELAELNWDAYLPDYVRSLAARGYVLIEGSRFRAAVAPLVEALLTSQELPEYVAQGWQRAGKAETGGSGVICTPSHHRRISGTTGGGMARQHVDDRTLHRGGRSRGVASRTCVAGRVRSSRRPGRRQVRPGAGYGRGRTPHPVVPLEVRA